jgi:hypothetical protein
MRLKTIAWISALAIASTSARAAEPVRHLVSRTLSAEQVSTNPPRSDVKAYRNYDGWTIRSADGKTFHLRTETCDFTIGEIPPYAWLKARTNDMKEGEVKFRYGVIVGSAKGLLRKGLTSGTVPKTEDDAWSGFSVTRTGFELDKFIVDYGFVGILTNPAPIAAVKPRAAIQPSCDGNATFAFYLGHVLAPKPAAFLEIFEFQDVFSPKFLADLEQGRQTFKLFLVWMNAVTPPRGDTKLGRALLKAMRP